jgi:DNA polymerase III delta prime subunit
MKKTILILSANPRHDLDLRREIHNLKGVIERSQEEEQFEIKISSAARPQDLQKLFLEHEPRIVHFCGHGTGEQGLLLEDNEGKEKLVSTSAISNLFQNFSDRVECVLLNACYSEKQADAIVQHINYAIGMRQEIRDDAAIIFARGFYQALGYGKSIPEAFDLGRNAIELEISNARISRSDVSEQERKLNPVDKARSVSLPESLKPQLKIKSPLTPFPSEELSADSAPFSDLTKAIQEEIDRKRYREARQEDFGLGQISDNRRQSLTQQEYRWRQVLLNKVKDSWIKGILENSLHAKVLFELDIKERRDAVERPFSDLEEFSQDSDKSFEWLQASDIFEEMGVGRTLLILGEPGTGKTISLLRLAERLIKRTEQNLSLSIPVVFNLSSWGNKRQPIVDWLVTELKDKYQVSKALGKQWIEEESLILLLDGLDEVKVDYRNDCVKALNTFIETHSVTEMVICSRVQDYEALSERLYLRSAICIQPLTSEYINWYLEDLGAKFEGLKTLLKQDCDLSKFAQTPLILSVMILTYQEHEVSDLLKELEDSAKRYQNLFNSYIEQMLVRRKLTKPKVFKDNITKSWLTYLSKELINTSQSMFLIESLQPNWLVTNIQKYFYGIGLGIYNFLLVFFLPVLLVKKVLLFPSFMFNIVLLSGILYCLKEGWNTSNALVLHKDYYSYTGDTWAKWINPFSTKIETMESLSWSWKKILPDIFVSIFILIIANSIPNVPPDLLKIMSLIIPSILFTRGIIVLKISNTSFPNEKIWRSVTSALKISLIVATFSIPAQFFFLQYLGSSFDVSFPGFHIDLSLFDKLFVSCGTTLMSLSSLFTPCFKHFWLRFILFRSKNIPGNYAKFLDYVTERLFLQKVGGGYIFIHRMLMEHFAQMEEDGRRS